MKTNKTLKRLAQTLLATTSLTVATVSAQVVNESPQSDFSNSSGSPTLLASGTTTVHGGVCFGQTQDCPPDFGDWFAIPGLTMGDTISITESNTGAVLSYFVRDDQGNQLASGQLNGITPVNFSVTAPTDGELVFGEQFLNESGGGATYSVGISDVSSATPEPGTVETGALAVAAALALRRKLRKA